MIELLIKLLGLFVPRETPGESGGDNKAGDEGGGNEGGDEEGKKGDPPYNPDGKPPWLPDKFWDEDVGVRAEQMAKSFTELEGKLRSKREDLLSELEQERRENVPEKYEITMPEDLEFPEGVEVTLKEDDPIAEWFMGFAKEQGLSQEQFDEAVHQYIKLEVEGLPDMSEELKKLGDYGPDRLQRVNTFLEKRLDEDHYKALQPMLTSAETIEALEALMKGATPSDFDGESGGKALSLEELRTMQKDPKYWRDQDPAFIKKVQQGYERLYGKG